MDSRRRILSVALACGALALIGARNVPIERQPPPPGPGSSWPGPLPSIRSVTALPTPSGAASGTDVFLAPPGSGEAFAEVIIDANPLRPSNLAVCGHGGPGGVNTWSTDDGWQTWRSVPMDERVDGILYGGRFDPALTFDGHGNLFVGFGTGHLSSQGRYQTTLFVARSSDGGHSFEPAVPVSTRGDTQLPGVDKWHLAAGPDPVDPARQNVYIAWTSNLTFNIQAISVSRSLDGGRTFSPPLTINDQASGGREYALVADPAVGPNGELYVSWFDYNGAPRIMVDKSFDAGIRWGTDVEIVRTTLNWKFRIPPQPDRGISPGPVLDVDVSPGPRRGRLYITYCDGNGADTNVFVRHSDDHGAHWSDPVIVHDVTRNCQFLPWLDVDPVSGAVHVVFYDSRDDPANIAVYLYHAVSLDGGVTFEPNTRLSDMPSDATGNCNGTADFLEYIGVVSTGCDAWAVWTDLSTSPCRTTFAVDRVTRDLAPPTLNVTLDRHELWPPDHRMVEVNATLSATDDCDPSPRVELVSVTSSEPGDGGGDGATEPDVGGADLGWADTAFHLRAERNGSGAGRTYTIVYSATDGAGHVTLDSSTVHVVHDQRLSLPGDDLMAAPGAPASAPADFLTVSPNPSAAGFAVSFRLPGRQRVTAGVYDARGALVRRLADDVFAEGEHRLEWAGERHDGRRVPAGVYFLRVASPDLKATRKLVCVR